LPFSANAPKYICEGFPCREGKRFAINLKNNHSGFSAFNTLKYRVILSVSLLENNFLGVI
jgi:hypothetical protein